MISVHFQGKPFDITVIQVYAPNSNAEEAKVEWFYEDLQELLELTPKKDVLFIIGDLNAKIGSREIPGVSCTRYLEIPGVSYLDILLPGVTGKFGFGEQNESGQRLTNFCQEKALLIANTLFHQHKR